MKSIMILGLLPAILVAASFSDDFESYTPPVDLDNSAYWLHLDPSGNLNVAEESGNNIVETVWNSNTAVAYLCLGSLIWMDGEISTDMRFTGDNLIIGLMSRIDIASGEYFPSSYVVIINYDILYRHIDKIHAIDWDFLIIDECQYLKNAKAKRTKLVVGARGVPSIKAKKKLALTGTPILNRPIELHNILRYLDPWGWAGQFEFAKRYCNAKHTRFGLDFNGASHLDELQNKLRSSVMVRRLKEEVLFDLPDKVRQVIELDPDSATRKTLKKEMDFWETAVAAVGAKDPENLTYDEYAAVVSLMRGGHSKLNFETMSTVRKESALSKVPMVIEHLKEAIESSGKVVVFCHHTEVAKALYEAFSDDNNAVIVIGETPMQKRQDNVWSFQNLDTVKLFIGNIQAAGVGITLTAASHVVFAEISWVPGEVSQAEDRCHRIGQKNSVLVQHLVLAGSIDSIMAKTIVKKQNVIEKAMDQKMDPELKELLK